jgi:signal peptidase II
MKTISRLVLLVGIVIWCVGCDQMTKVVATAALSSGPAVSYFGDTVRLSYAENAGGFLSFGDHFSPTVRSWIFGGVPALTILVLLVIIVRSPTLRQTHLVAMALYIGGGLGNLIDRVVFGVVRDFLNVGVGPVRTGIFNLADVAVMAGVVILCFVAANAAVDDSYADSRER